MFFFFKKKKHYICFNTHRTYTFFLFYKSSYTFGKIILIGKQHNKDKWIYQPLEFVLLVLAVHLPST